MPALGSTVVSLASRRTRRMLLETVPGLRKTFDALSVGVVITDDRCTVLYRNRVAADILGPHGRDLEGTCLADLLDVDVERAACGLERGPVDATLDLGSATLPVRIDRIDGGRSPRRYTFVLADPVPASHTDPQRDRLRAMMDEAPVAIVFADTERVIRYLNASSSRTLRGLAAYLACDIDGIVGQSVDVLAPGVSPFPEVLADPSALPRKAVLELGPDSLEVEVHALHDPRGEPLGFMVSWRSRDVAATLPGC